MSWARSRVHSPPIGTYVSSRDCLTRRWHRGYTNAGHTISAVLSFDEGGDLVGFISQDRYQSDGKSDKLFPWSTPLADYRDFGEARLASEGEARWVEPGGEWTYGKFVLERISYNGE